MSKQKVITILATVGFIGKAPKAPGTLGSLAALGLWLLLTQLTPMGYIVMTLLICVLGIVICQAYEEHNNSHDASEIVIDEVAGMLITLALMPVNWKVALLGFLLFRFLDILKPFPIGVLDKKVPGGFGVMVDDIVAGLIANMILQSLWQFKPELILV